MKVLLLLLLPLLCLSVKTGYMGEQCGSKKGPFKKEGKKVNCEEGTSCQQWTTKKGKPGPRFCLLEECLLEGDFTKEGKLKVGLCCPGLKVKAGQCVQESDQETPDNNSKEEQESDQETPDNNNEEEQVPTSAKSYDKSFCATFPKHTMCTYPGVGSACPADMESGFTDAGKKLIVDTHNELRSKVAQGLEDAGAVGGQPKASNMRALRWSEELAEVAQRWADQCIWGHDKDRKKLDGTYVGQNAYMGMASKQTKEEVMANMAEPVQHWYGEVSMPGFDSANINPFVPETDHDKTTGHYTQVVWADTEEIGCGWSYYMEDGWWKSMVQCNYAIGGNMAGSAMYQVGEPCSSCPAGYTCNSAQLCQDPAE